MINHIPDMAYEIKGEMIELQQERGSKSVYNIFLHRIHFDHIASKLGIPSLTITAETIKRRLEIIEARINALATSTHYRGEIIKNCGSGIEFLTELDAACELASEFLSDIDVPQSKEAN